MDYEAFTQMMIADMRAHAGQVTTGPMAGKPLMLLTSKGAKSGTDRTAIITWSREGNRYVIAASKSGAPENPAWYHNLKANPEATVELGGETFRVRATEATGAERDRLWRQHTQRLPEFLEYPKKTSRVIPMFFVDRID
jgi:deazaflavin-dependent oxidoreductase (nitroreductase family)